MLNGKLEQRSGRTQDRATGKIFRNRLGLKSRRHNHDSQLRPCPLQSLQQRQRKIALQMAFVKLVEHNSVDTPQHRIRKQAPGKHPFSHEAQARPRADRLFKPNLVANGFANVFAAFPRDPTSREPRRNPSWFQHNHVTAHNSEHGRRHARSLPRAGRCHDHQVWLQS